MPVQPSTQIIFSAGLDVNWYKHMIKRIIINWESPSDSRRNQLIKIQYQRYFMEENIWIVWSRFPPMKDLQLPGLPIQSKWKFGSVKISPSSSSPMAPFSAFSVSVKKYYKYFKYDIIINITLPSFHHVIELAADVWVFFLN